MAGLSRLAGSLLLVLVVTACGADATDGPAAAEASSPAPSSPAPPSSSPADDVTATDVVDDPTARLVDVAVSPTDPEVRAAVWWTCPTPACSARHVAVAVTTDGFRSRVLADRVWRSVPTVTVDARGNAIVASYGQRVDLTLVRPDGSLVDVRRSPEESPADAGEIVAGVEHGRGGTSFLATDPLDGTAHAITVPADTRMLERLPSGQLRALTLRRTYAWSDDGGATWVEAAGASEGTLLQSFTTSAPDVHVVVGGSDGATLFPFSEIRRLDEQDSWSVTAPPDRPMAYVGATAVLPDGRFLADVDDWSDDTPPGLYVSDGDDWTAYSRLDLGAPFAEPAFEVPDVQYVDVAGARTTLGAIGPDGRSWWMSTDLGKTWGEQRVR